MDDNQAVDIDSEDVSLKEEPTNDIHYCVGMPEITIFGKSFWDLWFQKMLRNIASVKYQFMVAFFAIVTYGMLFAKNANGEFVISPTEGLSFLSAGFLSLATTRIIMRTSLIEPKNYSIDTDK